MDAMSVPWMCADGHSREAAAETVRACAPTIREDQAKGRNRQRCGECTAEYAFGPAGDRDWVRSGIGSYGEGRRAVKERKGAKMRIE